MPNLLELVGIVAQGLGLTVLISVVALVVGSVLAAVLTRCRLARNRAAVAFSHVWVKVWRGVPPIAWLLIVFLGLGRYLPGMTAVAAACLVLSLIASAYLTEIFVSGIRAVPVGQFEASAALAIPGLYRYRSIIIPQAARISIPAIATYAIGLVKESAVTSVIGVQDLTFFASRNTAQTGDGLWPFIVAGLFYLALSVPVALVGRYTANVLNRSLTRRMS